MKVIGYATLILNYSREEISESINLEFNKPIKGFPLKALFTKTKDDARAIINDIT